MLSLNWFSGLFRVLTFLILKSFETQKQGSDFHLRKNRLFLPKISGFGRCFTFQKKLKRQRLGGESVIITILPLFSTPYTPYLLLI